MVKIIFSGKRYLNKVDLWKMDWLTPSPTVLLYPGLGPELILKGIYTECFYLDRFLFLTRQASQFTDSSLVNFY